jgi:hypothetical protein
MTGLMTACGRGSMSIMKGMQTRILVWFAYSVLAPIVKLYMIF